MLKKLFQLIQASREIHGKTGAPSGLEVEIEGMEIGSKIWLGTIKINES